ncbi:MAG TPA: 5-oxoprolinase subunit PxpA [Saprospiraceae bacterium]|nr:5-oxoprolinase subunit PxpA [Saprospiraceae bacterium]
MSLSIDINCDLGESYGRYRIGNDAIVFPLITSANIACGFHGGDPLHIQDTIKAAIKHQVQIGAHPGYPDLMGFGRRAMQIPAEELKAIIRYQIAAVKGLTESLGGQLHFVKPHGALYNKMARDHSEAETVIEAILSMDKELAIMGLAGSHLREIVERKGGRFIAEAFADRRYEADGKLRSRNKQYSVLENPEVVAQQVLSIARDQQVEAYDGSTLSLQADSICIHGDNPKVESLLASITSILAKAGISKKPF